MPADAPLAPPDSAAPEPGFPFSPEGDDRASWVRLRTLTLVRWCAIAGQLAALGAVERWLRIDTPIGPAALLIAASALLNLALGAVYPANARVSARQLGLLLLFDTAQLMGLVALTGGLDNPFALLVLAPVSVAALALPRRGALAVSGAAVGLTLLVRRFHLPLTLADGTMLTLPAPLALGFASAIVIAIVFIAAYARSVSQEMHTMSEALLAARLALAREQKLTDLAGVVAAAAHELGTPLATIKLASSELVHDLADRPDLAEDAALIRDQADRCRDILRSMGRAGKRDSFIDSAPLSEVLREAAEPHLQRGRRVVFAPVSGPPPTVLRRPELIHALRNLVQNAVDFADSTVWVESEWRDGGIQLRVIDDGPGFPEGLIARLGDPFLPRRDRPASAPEPGPRQGYDGMGMGLFIAKTLLERTGAELVFANHRRPDRGGHGALVRVTWPARARLAVPGPAGRTPQSPHIE